MVEMGELQIPTDALAEGGRPRAHDWRQAMMTNNGNNDILVPIPAGGDARTESSVQSPKGAAVATRRLAEQALPQTIRNGALPSANGCKHDLM